VEALTLQPDAHHRFVVEECDWGFTRFIDLRKLHSPFDPASGKNRPTIENDEVEVTAFVRVLKDPTGVLWHNFVKCVTRCLRNRVVQILTLLATTRRRRLDTSD
jgi:hypothetical protein